MTKPDGNACVVLRARPQGAVTTNLFALETRARPTPGDGEFVVHNRFLSIDPAMRGWIAENANYREPVPLGDVMFSFAVGEVLESRHPDHPVGQCVFGRFGWQEFALSDGKTVDRVVDPDVAPISTSLGALGINGATAWFGLMEVGQPKTGETVLVSTAAGAVGSAVGQIAKDLGCRTVGLTGSDEKVAQCLDVFGFDAAINYRKHGSVEALTAALADACPDGIDVFFDNVGGDQCDAAIELINDRARIVVCGTIGIPSAPAPMGPRYNRALLVHRARMEGFLVLDHFHRLEEAVAALTPLVRDGRLRYAEDVVDGLENAPAALVRVLSGQNTGKQIVRLG